jgi:hypothetical protein
MTLIDTNDTVVALNILSNAIWCANNGEFDDALEYLRDLEGWAQDFNNIVNEAQKEDAT